MTVKKWKKISSEIVFDKWRKIEKVTFEMPDGKIDDYYLKREDNSAAVLALTPDNEVILAKQYRPGLDEILLELPGGLIENGSNPEETARRELLEETGYTGKLELATPCYADGYSDFIRYYFVATGCEKVNEQKLDSTEFIEVELLPLDAFRKLLRSGKMTDTQGAYLGLDYLGLL